MRQEKTKRRAFKHLKCIRQDKAQLAYKKAKSSQDFFLSVLRMAITMRSS